MRTNIVQLEADHPGFNDPEYRRRRDEIAQLAADHRPGQPLPRVVYSAAETATWRSVFSELTKLFPTHACREYNDAIRRMGFSVDEIPQLADVDAFLLRETGFRIQPVAGLVSSREFLTALSRRFFPATQYIRHHSGPHYTPEPDVIHELLGHVPMLAIQEYAELTQKIGEATLGAPDAQIEQFSRLYWYTIEFGLVRQDGRTRAYGAGLLSSSGELSHSLAGGADGPEIRTFAPEVASQTPNPITTYQPVLWEVSSIGEAFRLVSAHIDQIRLEG
jgi:phenylalanine-4-hydroxylase